MQKLFSFRICSFPSAGSTDVLAGSTDQTMDGSTGPSIGLLLRSVFRSGYLMFFTGSGPEVVPVVPGQSVLPVQFPEVPGLRVLLRAVGGMICVGRKYRP